MVLDPETSEDLPPSCLLVAKVLEYEGPLTQGQIATEARLTPRTVRYALDRLDENGLIDKSPYLPDARKDLYELTP